MNCPGCTKPMTVCDFGGVEVDVCESGCRGLWFDWDELPQLDEPHEGFGAALDEALAQPQTGDRRGRLTCPRCRLSMHEHRYSGAPAVMIDECYGCRGLFLDPGELGTIRDHLAITHVEDEDDDGDPPLAWPESPGEREEVEAHREAVTSVCDAVMRRLRPYGY